ncbi:MAG: hypothetical protein HPM95_06530 [Alphaproteobacteria bacterium]|nr:hypothetical protein [Alphaproteobacteria bacterium]
MRGHFQAERAGRHGDGQSLPTAGVDYPHVPFGGGTKDRFGPANRSRYAAEFTTTVKTAYTLLMPRRRIQDIRRAFSRIHTMTSIPRDVAVIGGGIIGLSSALARCWGRDHRVCIVDRSTEADRASDA